MPFTIKRSSSIGLVLTEQFLRNSSAVRWLCRIRLWSTVRSEMIPQPGWPADWNTKWAHPRVMNSFCITPLRRIPTFHYRDQSLSRLLYQFFRSCKGRWWVRGLVHHQDRWLTWGFTAEDLTAKFSFQDNDTFLEKSLWCHRFQWNEGVWYLSEHICYNQEPTSSQTFNSHFRCKRKNKKKIELVKGNGRSRNETVLKYSEDDWWRQENLKVLKPNLKTT